MAIPIPIPIPILDTNLKPSQRGEGIAKVTHLICVTCGKPYPIVRDSEGAFLVVGMSYEGICEDCRVE